MTNQLRDPHTRFDALSEPSGELYELTGLNLEGAKIPASVRRVRSEGGLERLKKVVEEHGLEAHLLENTKDLRFWAALHKERMIALAYSCHLHTDYSLVGGLWVMPEHRKQEVGRLLLTQMAISARLRAPGQPLFARGEPESVLAKTLSAAGFSRQH